MKLAYPYIAVFILFLNIRYLQGRQSNSFARDSDFSSLKKHSVWVVFDEFSLFIDLYAKEIVEHGHIDRLTPLRRFQDEDIWNFLENLSYQ